MLIHPDPKRPKMRQDYEGAPAKKSLDLHAMSKKLKAKNHYDKDGNGGMFMTKNIYQLQQRVKNEIANNVIRPENTAGQESADVLDQNEADQEQHERFKELISDFKSDRYTKDAYGQKKLCFNPALDKPDQEKKYHTNLVNKVMTNNVIEPEDNTTKGFKTAPKKRKPQTQDGENIVEEMLILQLEEQK